MPQNYISGHKKSLILSQNMAFFNAKWFTSVDHKNHQENSENYGPLLGNKSDLEVG